MEERFSTTSNVVNFKLFDVYPHFFRNRIQFYPEPLVDNLIEKFP